MSDRRVYLSADRDGYSGGLQLSIGVQNADGGGHGYRIAGPKYCGNSTPMKRHFLTPRDARKIYSYIKPLLAQPSPEQQS